MKTIPVYDNFDKKKLIGHLTIDADKLSIRPDFHFALQGQILDKEILSDGTVQINRFELTAISAISDSDFTDKV